MVQTLPCECNNLLGLFDGRVVDCPTRSKEKLVVDGL